MTAELAALPAELAPDDAPATTLEPPETSAETTLDAELAAAAPPEIPCETAELALEMTPAAPDVT